MGKVLGLDLGTNSIGWAIVDEERNDIIGSGVRIFPSAADNIGTSKESLKNAVRRNARQIRRQFFRRKLRKIKLLEVLIKHNLCPLSTEILNRWKKRVKGEIQKFPQSEEFNKWLKLNPLNLRDKATKEQLSLHEFGRVLYNLIQKRGFLSNRKTLNDKGAMYKGKPEERILGIADTEKELEKGLTLGSFLYNIFKKDGEKYKFSIERVRGRYTLRQWYINEFNILWDKQSPNLGLDKKNEIYKKRSYIGNIDSSRARKKIERLKEQDKIFNIDNGYIIVEEHIALKDLIGDPNFGILFFQRPLRSQKHLLSLCSFESHKILINNNGERIEKTVGKRVCSASHPDFEKYRTYKFINSIKFGADLSLNDSERNLLAEFILSKDKAFDFKKISEFLDMRSEKFNYADDFKVFGSPYTAIVKKSVSEELWNDKKKYEELWNVFYFYKDGDKLKNKLKKDFNITDEKILNKLEGMKLSEDYSNLSKKAIMNILEFLIKGYQEHIAILLGGVKNAIGKDKWSSYGKEKIKEIEDEIYRMAKEKKKSGDLIKNIVNFIYERENIPINKIYDKIYHHSEEIIQNKTISNKLGDIENLRNPIVQQSLNEMKKLVNKLIDKYLDEDENFKSINIELARELKLPKSKRQLISKENSDREKINRSACDILDEYGLAHSRDNIHKYLLYKELETENGIAICPYTGKTIGISDILGDGNKFQVEHIIPYSISLDDSLKNKTLCESIENNNKGNLTPYQFYKNNLVRWEEVRERAYKLLPYEKAKLFTSQQNFQQDDFIERQLNDTRYITKKALEYLKTICSDVFSLPGSLTADLRNKWGLNNIIRDPSLIDTNSIVISGYGKYWAEYGDSENINKITNLYPKYNKKPIPDNNEIIITGEIINNEFAPDSNFELKLSKIKLSEKYEDGKHWASVKFDPYIQSIQPVKKPYPLRNNDNIILIGNMIKNQFINKQFKFTVLPIAFQDDKERPSYCKLTIDINKISFKQIKPKPTENTIILSGKVSSNHFFGFPNIFSKKVELPDGRYYAEIPYFPERTEISPLLNIKPSIENKQILLYGMVRENVFIPNSNPNLKINLKDIILDGQYWAVFNLTGEIGKFVRKENILPKVENQIKLEEGEIGYNSESEEYYFYSGKDRTDHRHHAIDAITIAMAKRGHLQKLSAFNAIKIERKKNIKKISEKLRFETPWDNFTNDAKKSIENILISHKYHNPTIKKVIKNFKKDGKSFRGVGLSVRGALHKDTIYGLHKRPLISPDGKFTFNNGRIVTENENYCHVRKKLSDIKDRKQIEKIVDYRIKEIIYKLIEQTGGFVKDNIPNGALFEIDEDTKTIKSKVLLPNKKGEPVPINKVRIRENISNVRCVKPSYKVDNIEFNQYVNPRNNHHIMIYKNKNGDLSEDVVQFWDVIQRKMNKNPIYQLPEDGVEIVTTMEINDMFILGIKGSREEILKLSKETLSLHLYRVQKLSSSYYTFRPHLNSTTETNTEYSIRSFSKWIEENPIKVKLSEIGEIS